MTLLIPPPVLMQALIAAFAGLGAVALGVLVLHRAWLFHCANPDCLSPSIGERHFLLGFILLVIGVHWVIDGSAIVLGALYGSNDVAGEQVQSLVVFANATTRSIVFLISAHLVWEWWKGRERGGTSL
jgi:hypothetical protein